MNRISEKDLLRLAMILENQGETTRNKYICKLSEYIIYDSEKLTLSSIDICNGITERFQLEFDLTEVENAIHLKGNGRIIASNSGYKLSAKANNQLASQISPEEKLCEFVKEYARCIPNVNWTTLLGLIQKHLYMCFNSNAKNFSSIIGGNIKETINYDELNEYRPLPREIELINGFLLWNNAEKDKLLYSIISSCYEYCLITTNKNPAISKAIFKGKRFFVDTNIIFRFSGINKDDREFVIKRFVEKCHEVGILLCYTSTVFDEIYRVIDKQIEFIKRITDGQPPIDFSIIKKISDGFEVNDFYDIYCNWCKQAQNRYNDYLAFRNFLLKKINSALSEFEYIDSSIIKGKEKERCLTLFYELKKFKNEKKSNRTFTDDSIKTDVNQILFIESLRPKSAKNLWQMNEYLISADQLLIMWAEETFEGIPMVVLPSLWLSIILKVAGRASNDDYQSFCRFMTLRHYHTDADDIHINPIELLSKISEKTINKEIKELVINEIVNNKNYYLASDAEDYELAVERAFDKVLSAEKQNYNSELIKQKAEHKQEVEELERQYREELSQRHSSEKYAKIIASEKARQKVEWFAQRENIPLTIEGVLFFILLLLFVLCYILKVDFFVELITKTKDIGTLSLSPINFSMFTWVYGIFTVTLPAYLHRIWKYLSSKKRQEKLCAKYFRQHLKFLCTE